jgi:hypothetical protein
MYKNPQRLAFVDFFLLMSRSLMKTCGFKFCGFNKI